MAEIFQGQREEAVAVVLEELLQEELRGGRKERVLAVGGADVTLKVLILPFLLRIS